MAGFSHMGIAFLDPAPFPERNAVRVEVVARNEEAIHRRQHLERAVRGRALSCMRSRKSGHNSSAEPSTKTSTAGDSGKGLIDATAPPTTTIGWLWSRSTRAPRDTCRIERREDIRSIEFEGTGPGQDIEIAEMAAGSPASARAGEGR